MSPTGTAVAMGAREVVRQPVLVALFVFLPAYLVGVFTIVVPDTGVTIQLSSGPEISTTLGDVVPAVMAPLAAALLGGIAGLLLVQSMSVADRRLLVVGYRARQLVVARLALLSMIGLVASVAAVAAMRLAFAPASLGWFVVATVLAALIYATSGMIIGALFNRLIGIYLILFGSFIDLFLFQNPIASDAPVGAAFTPGRHPLDAAMDAAFGDDVPYTSLASGFGVLTMLVVVAVWVIRRSATSAS